MTTAMLNRECESKELRTQVDSLDQLYCQAVALSPLLISKVPKVSSKFIEKIRLFSYRGELIVKGRLKSIVDRER